jgi:4-coumarate--CoA ligase
MMWDPTQQPDAASVGELVPNCEAKIMHDDGVTSLPPGQRGELWCRAPTTMKGYWNNPQATRESITSDGWLKTGDIAVQDEQRKYYIVDRKKVGLYFILFSPVHGPTLSVLIVSRNLSKSKVYK